MSVVVPDLEVDPFDTRIVRSARGALRAFNDAGVLAAADVHVALRLGRLGSDADDRVLLGAAFAVRAPRLGHVCVDLAVVREGVVVEGEVAVDVDDLPWPDPDGWVAAVAASDLVGTGEGEHDRPLRLVGSRLYLDRYWREEQQVAGDLLDRSARAVAGVDEGALEAGLGRLFAAAPGAAIDDELQRTAAATAVRRHLAVVAGGPGTGKTTTVARILALLHEQAEAAGGPPPLVALAAPTGKAAARLEEAVHQEAATLDVSDEVRTRLLAASASTLHRLLGWKPGNRARFRHDRRNRLPHEVVIVDETSMVSLTLMARLLEAVRPGARLILVGDPEQLASVEAGAVLGDIVGGDLQPSTVVLRRVHRFGGAIAELATAVQAGAPAAVLDVLGRGADDVVWVDADAAGIGSLDVVREAVVVAGRALHEAATAGDGRRALEALGRFRLLCAHRRGDHGVSVWTDQVEAWLAAAIDGFGHGLTGPWYPGRPLLFTENDYGLQLFNGDTGVVVAVPGGGGGVRAVFERRGRLVELSPHRLGRVETVHAMTVHKAQGSQFDEVALLLPDETSPILTRELLYTAATRARRRLLVVGTEAAVTAAVARPIARASGLRELLRGAEGRGGRLTPPWLDELAFAPGPPWHGMGTRALADAAWLVVDDRRDEELDEKRRLLAEAHEVVVAQAPDAETAAAAGEAGALVAPGARRLEEAAVTVQEDLCVLVRREDGWRLEAGVVCFPSMWRIADKLGRPLSAVHGPVPAYAEELADRVDRFLDRLRPERSVWRRNWLLHTSPALHQPAPPVEDTAPVVPSGLWLRSERQTLRRLPRTGAVLFTIRTQQAPLAVVGHRPPIASAMAAAVRSWSDDLVAYRSAHAWREPVLEWLDDVGRAGAQV